jgi:hypothetical protein
MYSRPFTLVRPHLQVLGRGCLLAEALTRRTLSPDSAYVPVSIVNCGEAASRRLVSTVQDATG